MSRHRRQLIDLIEQGAIPAEKIESALNILKIRPDGRSWRTFIDSLLLWLEALALAFSIMFFIAYNWKELGRFARFGMVEGFIILSIVAYCKLDEKSLSSRVSLLVATIALGVLLALYGQTYQTGADPWQLFFNWALMMLPWALISRFPAIWIVWIALINLSITLYYLTFRGIFGFVFGSESGVLWVTFIFNTLVFVVWQLLAKIRNLNWLSKRWAIRLLALCSGVPLTWLVLFFIVDYQEAGGAPVFLTWTLWLAAMYFVYRKVKPDLFMLAGCCLSTITITVTFLGKYMLDQGNPGAFLFLAMVAIGMGASSALWLKNLQREYMQ